MVRVLKAFHKQTEQINFWNLCETFYKSHIVIKCFF